ncbi:hypothetical protein QBC32DRAFT_311605 [Pseudoneurospora amorphoporcata]|uniref:DUF7918 domain-containing protein n=1 Tax=Pseudoneurospora amorphoporcata TaxID=241081 RepID=A0AAN6P1R6_9PEZI|nr:hypothetical protein QBC32DRAFT_311605 [Pseudoneurospora amorphoporcata]
MAVLTCYPGLEVAVEVDGQRAQEYDAPADEIEAGAKELNFHSIPDMPIEGSPPYIIKYIESKPGKPFAFQLDSTNFAIPSSDNKKHLVQYRCVLDGISTGYNQLVGGAKSMEGGNGKQGDRTKEYGTLLVKLWDAIDLKRTRPKAASRRSRSPVPVQSVSEKALKGRSVDSKVVFDTQPSSAYKRVPVVHYPDRRPFAVFEFRYRTMEGLMCEGIVPRPVNEDDDQVVDVEKEQQPLNRVKPDPENTRGIKREFTDPNPMPVCYKLRGLENGKVEIDLTDD